MGEKKTEAVSTGVKKETCPIHSNVVVPNIITNVSLLANQFGLDCELASQFGSSLLTQYNSLSNVSLSCKQIRLLFLITQYTVIVSKLASY